MATIAPVAPHTRRGKMGRYIRREGDWLFGVCLSALVFLAPVSVPNGVRLGYLTVGLVLSLLILPALLRFELRLRSLRAVLWLLVLCVPAGMFLALFPPTGDSPRLENWPTVLTLPVAGALTLLLLRYAVKQVGPSVTAGAYALGMIVNAAIQENVDILDPWWLKRHLAWPIVVLLLADAESGKRKVAPWMAATICASLAIISEYRSLLVFVGMALILSVAARRSTARGGVGGAKPLRLAATIALAGAAIYTAVSWAAMAGILGSDVAIKSQQQAVLGGSLLSGARVESPATISLMLLRPQGFGPGFVPGLSERDAVYSAIPATEISASVRQYVETYMLDDPMRLHSIVGDLWLQFGLVGLLTAVFLGWLIVDCFRYRVSCPTGLFLSMTLLSWAGWDLLFSPIYSNLCSTIAIMCVLAPWASGNSVTERTGDQDRLARW